MRGLPAIALVFVIAGGCARWPNPSFPLSENQAVDALKEMRSAPVPLQRPLVILGGFVDAGLGTSFLRLKIDPAFDDRRILVVNFADCISFEQCRERLVRAVSSRFGWSAPGVTAEVDVIGRSMGGLVALVGSADFNDGTPRVNARRIFTLSSPLRGARLADLTPLLLVRLHRDMKSESGLYRRLQTARIDAELYSYTRLGDPVVGADLASLDGHSARWVDTPPLQPSHIVGMIDNRILADVLRRLRGESPFSLDPPAPLPIKS